MGFLDKLFGTAPERKSPSKSLKDLVLERQGNRCYRCNAPFTYDNMPQYHHNNAVYNGGQTTRRNMKAMCASCHDHTNRRQTTRRAQIRRSEHDVFNFDPLKRPPSRNVQVRRKTTTTPRRRKSKSQDDIFGLGQMQKEFDSIFGSTSSKRKKRRNDPFDIGF